MLTCIKCSKQRKEEGGEEEGRGTPSTKDAGKSLTAQIKDMASKFSVAYRQCKPCPGSSSYKKGHRAFPDFDTISEGIPHPYLNTVTSSSTPAWDFATNVPHQNVRSASRFTSALSGEVVLEDEDEPKEWMAQVEPGIQITFVSLPSGGNDLKRIRFSREMFNKWQAQQWWGENYDRIMELYNVQRFNRQDLNSTPRSEDERNSSYSRLESARESPMTPSLNQEWTQRNYYKPSKQHLQSDPSDSGNCTGGPIGERSSVEASRSTTSSREETSISISNGNEMESEWVEQDEPGVYITIRQLVDGTRELQRVRFSRERFGEANAKLWWEQNKDRIQSQYL